MILHAFGCKTPGRLEFGDIHCEQLPCVDPNYSPLPAMAGDEYKYQRLNRSEWITAPEATLRAYNKLESEVTK